MSKPSHKLPAHEFVVEMKHKYAVGDMVVCVRKRHAYEGQYGIITELFPFKFNHPAYRVQFGGKIVALSELSLRKAGMLIRLCALVRRVAQEWRLRRAKLGFTSTTITGL